MTVEKTSLPGVLLIKPKVHGDNRGWFMETYSEIEFKRLGIICKFVQDNHSFSEQKGVLRGLHFQNEPHAQAKLLRCICGKILDIVVDVRKGSPDYLKWEAFELSDENKDMIFIPKGFAHGFLTLTGNVEILYKVDSPYNADNDRSILWNDSTIGVEWGTDNPIISDKDKNAPLLQESDCNFEYRGN